MYSFFSETLADALIEAHQQGRRVVMIVDKNQGRRSKVLEKLARAGVPLRWTSGRAPGGVMHHKFAIFDRKLLALGSYNMTYSGEHHNFENVNFTTQPDGVADFLEELQALYAQGQVPDSSDFAPGPQQIDDHSYSPSAAAASLSSRLRTPDPP